MAGNLAAAGAAVAIAWTALAMRGLDRAGAAVEQALVANDLMDARREIRALVGRDPDSLDRIGLIRAAVESVAENSSDGVIAPMLYLFAGGPVAAIAYKAINTLDSMIGYCDDHYRWFGRAAARLDDLANLLPARITAVCLTAAAAIVSRRAAQAYAACLSSASMHRSPNAGYPESAMAGALGIQLGDSHRRTPAGGGRHRQCSYHDASRGGIGVLSVRAGSLWRGLLVLPCKNAWIVAKVALAKKVAHLKMRPASTESKSWECTGRTVERSRMGRSTSARV
jgi:cobalamin biosynthesis protein CobD/CbiB